MPGPIPCFPFSRGRFCDHGMEPIGGNWEATVTVLLAGLGQFPLGLGGPTSICTTARRCSGLHKWTPALYFVEFLNVGVKINPYQSLLQFGVVLQQIPISMHKRLQYLIYHILIKRLISRRRRFTNHHFIMFLRN